MDYTLDSMFDIKDKVIVVTGGSKGIGREIGIACASLGAKTILVASNNNSLAELNDTLKTKGLICDSMAFDVTNEKEVAAAADKIVEKYGRVDGLVTSAGVTHFADAESIEIENFQHVVNVNLTGTLICCKQFGKYL